MEPIPFPPPLPWRALEAAARQRLSREEAHFLMEAIELSRRGWGGVCPNPLVGCVLVRDGQPVGRGWHQEFGGPHAEVLALEDAGPDARGSTAFVSLEPCSHHGKTPPCTRALERAGVGRVVFGAADPTPDAGGGAIRLADAGIDIEGPVLSGELARNLDPRFFHQAEGHSSPWVELKLAVALDGSIAARPGERTAVTGEAAARYTHRLRAGFDAIMVGSGTASVDDPLLTARGDVRPRVPPVRVVLDSGATLSPSAALLKGVPDVPLWVFCAEGSPRERVDALKDAGAEVRLTARRDELPDGGGGVSLAEVLGVLAEAGIVSLLCEGGGTLASSLLAGGWVRRLHLFVAPRVLGPEGVPAFRPGVGLGDAEWRALGSSETLGADAHIVFDRSPGHHGEAEQA